MTRPIPRVFKGGRTIIALLTARPLDHFVEPKSFVGAIRAAGINIDEISCFWTGDRYEPLGPHLSGVVEAWTRVPKGYITRSIWLRESNKPDNVADVHVDLTGRSPFDGVSLTLCNSYYTASELMATAFGVARSLYSLTSPAYGHIVCVEDILVEYPSIGLPRGLPGIFWGNFLGPEYIDLIGRDKLSETGGGSSIQVQELEDGGCLVQVPALGPDESAVARAPASTDVIEQIGSSYFAPSARPMPAASSNIREAAVVPRFRFCDLRDERHQRWKESAGPAYEDDVRQTGHS